MSSIQARNHPVIQKCTYLLKVLKSICEVQFVYKQRQPFTYIFRREGREKDDFKLFLLNGFIPFRYHSIVLIDFWHKRNKREILGMIKMQKKAMAFIYSEVFLRPIDKSYELLYHG